MNKKEFTTRMAKDAGITHLQAGKAFNSLILAVRDSLRKGNKVVFSGFGSFEVKIRNQRKGRNPKTGEIIQIPRRKRIKFNPSKKLKNTL